MMIDCPKHGVSSGVLVSPDLKKALMNENEITDVIKIEYSVDDFVYEVIYVSKKFGAKLAFDSDQKLDVPSTFPKWTKELIPHCEDCYKECGGRIA